MDRQMDNMSLEVIKHYGINNQLKHFNSEVFELNEVIIKQECSNREVVDNDSKLLIIDEMADCLFMINQFKVYYGITDLQLEIRQNVKAERQLNRIFNEKIGNIKEDEKEKEEIMDNKIKALSIFTGAGIIDCKKALKITEGKVEDAIELLKILSFGNIVKYRGCKTYEEAYNILKEEREMNRE